ncbi:4Fe-4S cluster-binding domain-containing protein [Dactylosporangium sucinum]|uniref:Radical activating enzyme n=1 Tax=Dactylosporangium sucinum TaxID=1424081 RepID=A0A917X4Z9_9ACTN|nr:4Fe-4S cluster-binding domain-containing protein [Dactylosporangium sucinum]GGM76360.1 radical activating enzyme [Dactylosporangium sucinum]
MARLARVFFPVTALGPGRRLGVWFQGCPIACPGCMSRDTWAADGGAEVPESWFAAAWAAALAGGATGLTVSGGEPTEQPSALLHLLRVVRSAPHPADGPADVLVYTGRELDEFAALVPGGPDLVDALITGPYRTAEPTTLVWRGSANQRLHLLSDLGRERYAGFVAHQPERPPMQVVVGDDDVHYVGVPRPGTLNHMERLLRTSGVDLGRPSWRP